MDREGIINDGISERSPFRVDPTLSRRPSSWAWRRDPTRAGSWRFPPPWRPSHPPRHSAAGPAIQKGVPLGSLWIRGRTRKPWSVMHSPARHARLRFYELVHLRPLPSSPSIRLSSSLSHRPTDRSTGSSIFHRSLVARLARGPLTTLEVINNFALTF